MLLVVEDGSVPSPPRTRPDSHPSPLLQKGLSSAVSLLPDEMFRADSFL